MRFSSGKSFLRQKHKRITLMGMSNVGKTTLASSLPATDWFHYSIDYRLATAYLKEPIIDVLKKAMMRVPCLATHLREDLICIDLNVSFDNQRIVSHYLGKLGNQRAGGLSMQDFHIRQHRHREAEMQAMKDIPEFISKGTEIYGYAHFINDASGSLCEVINPYDENDPVLRSVIDNTVLVYLRADQDQERVLIERAIRHPKPLYYRPDFLEPLTKEYLTMNSLSSTDEMDPDDFVRWVFVQLLEARRPRYERIARHGYTLCARDLMGVSETVFLERLAEAIDRTASVSAVRKCVPRVADGLPLSMRKAG
jgi:hypothetical protein